MYKLLHIPTIKMETPLLLRVKHGKRFVFIVDIQVKLKEVSINERGRTNWNIILQIILSEIL